MRIPFEQLRGARHLVGGGLRPAVVELAERAGLLAQTRGELLYVTSLVALELVEDLRREVAGPEEGAELHATERLVDPILADDVRDSGQILVRAEPHALELPISRGMAHRSKLDSLGDRQSVDT